MSFTIGRSWFRVRLGGVDEFTVRCRDGVRFGYRQAGRMSGAWAPGVTVLRIRKV